MSHDRSKGRDRSHLTSSSRFACAPWLARSLSFVGAPFFARIIAIAPARLCTCFLHPFSIAVAVSVELRKVRGRFSWNLLMFYVWLKFSLKGLETLGGGSCVSRHLLFVQKQEGSGVPLCVGRDC